MKYTNQLKIATLLTLLIFAVGACKKDNRQEMEHVVGRGLERASFQALNMARSLENDSMLLPRSFENGQVITSDSRWWCSGFFPGVLWYLYENNPTHEIKKYALDYTARVEREQYTTDNHDVGFMIYCSFGNGLRMAGIDHYKSVILQAAKSLSTRYNDTVGLIRSWDFNQEQWQYPVIIDNMMNLEMLMWAAKETGDKRFETIALNHADKTMKEHFRRDYSCWHVVSYDTITGQPHVKQTRQGFSDPSAWARGEAWALYGYTMMYRETGLKRYLQQAENVARFILDHPRLPKDKIPYWDFDAPHIPNELRDASAGAIMASAFIELSGLTQDSQLAKRCMQTAETQLKTLASPQYLAEPGSNGNFILKHSVGSMPENVEVDVPLTYADYYFVEALIRYKKSLIK